MTSAMAQTLATAPSKPAAPPAPLNPPTPPEAVVQLSATELLAAMEARQLSKRGGELHVAVEGERVLISGNTSFYMEGQVFLPSS